MNLMFIRLNTIVVYKLLIAVLILTSSFVFFPDAVLAQESQISKPFILKEIDINNGGFRDLTWGRHISDCEDMVYESHKQTSGGNVKIYNRNNEKLLLDNKIKLAKIEYGFLNSKLLFIALKTSDPGNSKILREAVISKFGQNGSSPESAKLFWESGETNIILQSLNSSNQSILMLVSKKGLSSNFNE